MSMVSESAYKFDEKYHEYNTYLIFKNINSVEKRMKSLVSYITQYKYTYPYPYLFEKMEKSEIIKIFKQIKLKNGKSLYQYHEEMSTNYLTMPEVNVADQRSVRFNVKGNKSMSSHDETDQVDMNIWQYKSHIYNDFSPIRGKPKN